MQNKIMMKSMKSLNLLFSLLTRLFRCYLKRNCYMTCYFPHILWDVEIYLRGYIFWGNISHARTTFPPFVCLLPCLGFLCTFYVSEIFPFLTFWLVDFAFSMFVCFLCRLGISNLSIDVKDLIFIKQQRLT